MATEDRRKDLMVSLNSKHIWDSVRNAQSWLASCHRGGSDPLSLTL